MNNRFNLPESLIKLETLSMNLWFSWNPDARDLYREIDIELWRASGRNPVAFLKSIPSETINQFSENKDFIKKLDSVYQRFQKYMATDCTRFEKNFPHLKERVIAYFCAEYGVHESLPNYAGGLGILAGDHCKTASDLGLPFVAVGLMYKHAYFTQLIDAEGGQQEEYRILDHPNLPVTLIKNPDGEPLLVSVPILGREIYIKIWEVKIGRISLYLLDTTVDLNSDEDKEIIHSLYGGARDTRIKQEIILGIGGLRALRKMNIHPAVFHMNEGHSAFLGLERLFELMNDGMSFKMAREFVRSTTLFTTHTPIPAGNEAFEFEMMEKYFKDFWPELGISSDYFFDMGRNVNIHQHENFSLTILAINLSYMANGVSKLHGEISRKMWQKVFPGVPTEEIPIDYVTNGVHTESWLHRDMIKLFDDYIGADWRNHIYEEQYWDKIIDVPDEVFWETMLKMKKNMSSHLRRRYATRMARIGDDHQFPSAKDVLDDQCLTIGFSRRFAPYKRATLIFRDLDLLKKILNGVDRPVQILFSGKAHPHNEAGKTLIKKVNQYAKQEGLRGKIVFIEDYTINVSRSLISGVDVWLNTPRRPLEASGTSGQKVPINGGINLSILDGWWPEGYNGENGWTIGDENEYADQNIQDEKDGLSLYKILENEIIPLFYDQDKNALPHGWIKMAKESLRSNIAKFSAHTMVWSYTAKYYVPGIKRFIKYTESDFSGLFRFFRWSNRMNRHWKKLTITLNKRGALSEDDRICAAGEVKEVSVLIKMPDLEPQDLNVEVTMERQFAIKGHQHLVTYPMGLIGEIGDSIYEYRVRIKGGNGGSYRYNCRVTPKYPDMFNMHETRLIKWLD